MQSPIGHILLSGLNKKVVLVENRNSFVFTLGINLVFNVTVSPFSGFSKPVAYFMMLEIERDNENNEKSKNKYVKYNFL